MARSRSLLIAAASASVVAMAAAGCSGTDSSGSSAGSTPGTTVPAFTGNTVVDVTPPPAEGKGVALPQPAPKLPDGYTQEELLVGGNATRFDPVATPEDGRWEARPAGEAPYRTRVIVRRPPADRFSGTVVVEWFNVSAIEAAPDWAYLNEEVGREGHAYVGVSAQALGVEGGETILDVEVDEGAAASAGVSTDKSGLKNVDPDRYGTLTHPGDAYAFDIFRQVGQAVQDRPGDLLGGLEPKQVIGAGESQSAIFLSTLANAIQPMTDTFDGFFVHSRGANVAPLDGNFVSTREREDRSAAFAEAVRMRTDLDVPIVLLEAETDLTLLGYAHARQPDTERIRSWEVAGTAHADAHQIRSVIGGPRDPAVGSLLKCDNINTGPHHEVAQAAFHHLVAWAAGGPPPPAAPAQIETTGDGEVTVVRDDLGIAKGGVRTPLVDVPVVVLSGDPPGGGSIEDLASGDAGLCILFGSTTPIDQATLVARYGTAANYLEQFRASADRAVAGGYLLRPDADDLVAEAQANAALFPA